jgi:hypothetical protein
VTKDEAGKKHTNAVRSQTRESKITEGFVTEQRNK